MGNASSTGSANNSQKSKKIVDKKPTCYYELLCVSQEATADELKKAYRQRAFQLHPDKNPHRLEEAHLEFSAIQAAYEVLSDPQERAWYDRHRSAILSSSRNKKYTDEDGPCLDDLMKYFSQNVYNGYDDGTKGFFSIYRELFNYLEEFEAEEELQAHQDYKRHAPPTATFTSFGSKNSPYEPMVKQFYDKWIHFTSTRTFDQGDRYQPSFHDNRRMRRAMGKENTKERDRLKREFSETVRELAAFVKKRDPRYAVYQKEKTVQREREEAEQKAKDRQRRKEEAASFIEQDWAKIDDKELFSKIGIKLATTSTKNTLSDPENDVDDNIDKEGEWESKGEEEEEEEEEEEIEEIYCCAPCKKTFKNPAQWRNHEKSKKHRTKLLSLGIDPDWVEEEEEEEIFIDYNDNIPTIMTINNDAENKDIIKDDIEEIFTESFSSLSLARERKENDSNTDHDISDNLSETTATTTNIPLKQQSPKAMKKEKKNRRAKNKNDNAESSSMADQQNKCNVCNESFNSRNQLFKHIKDLEHAQVVTSKPKAKAKR